MEQLQALGRAEFKARNYDKALTLFDRAINKASSIQLLDYRSACHEKLGNLTAALQDAKQQISLAKEDATGYLRASHILIQMHKKGRALEVCEYGLNRINHVGRGYERLKQSQQSLFRELYPRRSIDPFTFLPRELAEQVLGYLSFKQMMNTCLVCKPWMQFVRSSPSLWQHLDMSGARRNVRNCFFSRAINVARSKISAISLNGNCDTAKVLTTVLRQCPIQDITLLSTGPFSISDVGILSHANALKSLCLAEGTEIRTLAFCALWNGPGARLEAFEVQNLHLASNDSSLRRLQQRLDKTQSFRLTASGSPLLAADVEKLLAFLPQVRTLSIFENSLYYRPIAATAFLDLRQLEHLQSLELRIPLHSSRLTLPVSLRTLSLSWPQNRMESSFFDIDDSDVMTSSFYLPNLVSLELRIHILKWQDLRRFLVEKDPREISNHRPATRLHHLAIEIDQVPSNSDLEDLVTNPRLQDLRYFALNTPLDRQSKFDALLGSILDNLTHLDTLDLSETTVTGVGIKMIVNKSNVKKLIIHSCHTVGRDAIDWARMKGVDISCQEEVRDFGGRKIRHG